MVSIKTYNRDWKYDNYMLKNTIINNGFMGLFLCAYIFSVLLYVLLYINNPILCPIINVLTGLLDKVYGKISSNVLSVGITLHIFTFTACSFLLKDDTSLGISVYEITNWKFPAYRIARISSMLSPILLLFFHAFDIKYLLCIYFLRLLFCILFQIYVCLNVFDYVGNSYVITEVLFECYDNKNAQKFDRYFSDLCTYVSRSKSRFGLNIVVAELIPKIANQVYDNAKDDYKNTPENLINAYKQIDYIVNMYVSYLSIEDNNGEQYKKNYNVANYVKELVSRTVDILFLKEDTDKDFDEKTARICSIVLSSAIIVNFVTTLDSSNSVQVISLLKNFSMTCDEERLNVYNSILATLEVYTELEFENLVYNNHSLSYLKLLVCDKSIEAQIKNISMIKCLQILFDCWSRKVHNSSVWANYQSRFLTLYHELFISNTKENCSSAIGLLVC